MSDSEVPNTAAPVVVDQEHETKQHQDDDDDDNAADGVVVGEQEKEEEEEEAQPFVESEVTAVTGTEQSSTTAAKQRPAAPFKDDAWIMDDAAAAAASSGQTGSSTKSPAKELLRPATEPKSTAPTTSGKPKAIAVLVGRVLGKLHIVVDAIETSRNFVLSHWLYCQAYVAVVLLLFGSYFLQTIKCYEALLRLGFLEKFGAHYGRVKAILETNKGQSGARKVSALRQQLRPHLGDIARTAFLCATCCLGILLSYLAGSLIVGASIGIRLNDYLDEYELRPPLSSLTKRIKKFDWTDEITTIVLIVLSTLFALIAPASATALCSILVAAKVLAKIKIQWGKPTKATESRLDAKLDVINYRFWTGSLIAIALVANFFWSLEYALPYKFLSLPLVILENIIGLFA